MATARPTVLLTNAIDPSGVEILARVADVVVAPDAKPDTLNRMVLDADVLMVRAFLPPNIFDGAHHLRGVVRHGVGLDMIPMESATAKGVPVANVPGSNAEAVAEHAIAGMLLVARRIHRMDRVLREDGWNASRKHSDESTELFGRTLGIVGMGNVGTRVAEIASAAFRMRVLGTASRSKPAPAFVEVSTPERILRESDFVVLACPLTDATRHLVNAERLATMKPGAAIVNVARGPVTDERALATALAEGRLRAAVVDVYEEQPIPPGHPFLALENIILTPHAAGITQESMKRMSRGAAEEAVRLVAFERPANLCNPSVWDAHLQRHRKQP
ncbi:MAG: hydroxyacid dehydrogenase [Betaproteobacteria bacterium]|nr:hydroxyacid dehydrogenase [Betaproteobacteria bacterium]